MAMIKVVTYYHRCDACGKDVISDGETPKTGVVGVLTFPDSAHGQRRTYTYFSCREHPAHVVKATKGMAEKRAADIAGRKARGEPYSAPKE